MGYEQGWHIGLLIYRLHHYRYFLKYRLSVSIKVRTDKIFSALGESGESFEGWTRTRESSLDPRVQGLASPN